MYGTRASSSRRTRRLIEVDQKGKVKSRRHDDYMRRKFDQKDTVTLIGDDGFDEAKDIENSATRTSS